MGHKETCTRCEALKKAGIGGCEAITGPMIEAIREAASAALMPMSEQIEKHGDEHDEKEAQDAMRAMAVLHCEVMLEFAASLAFHQIQIPESRFVHIAAMAYEGNVQATAASMMGKGRMIAIDVSDEDAIDDDDDEPSAPN